MGFLTTAEVATRLKVSARRVRELITDKRLPAEKKGRDYLINEKDLAKVKDRKTGRPPKLVRALLVLIGLSLGVTSCVQISNQSSKTYKITYQIAGHQTEAASVTYSNPGGGTEQSDVRLPWSHSFTAKDGDFLYISAQNDNYRGQISVYILVDGEPHKISRSEGGYVIASANSRCCSDSEF